MEELNREHIVKGQAVEAGGVRIVPIARWSGQAVVSGSRMIALGTMEPLGIQVLTATGQYALDLEGYQSEELAEV